MHTGTVCTIGRLVGAAAAEQALRNKLSALERAAAVHKELVIDASCATGAWSAQSARFPGSAEALGPVLAIAGRNMQRRVEWDYCCPAVYSSTAAVLP